MTWLLYGANGYTGTLVARRAVARGERPVLAGRSAGPVSRLAAELGLEHRVFDLTDPRAAEAGLAGVEAVAHCAGPFSATAAPMVRACLATGVHYLDVTGEIEVFEQLHAMSEQARDAGVVLLPGAGFDVVPTDCLALLLARALPGADRLDLAFLPGGGMSPGTARTALEGIRAGGRERVGGRITAVPVGGRRIRADFPDGPRTVSSVPWGDVSTAYHSTGIPDITTYTAVPRAAVRLQGLLRPAPVQALARAAVSRFLPGPGERRRSRTRTQVWGRASRADGRTATASLTGPDPYDLTADSVVRAVTRLRDLEPGTLTPSRAFGPRYVAELDGVRLTEPAAGA
ncbi:trans-acting enoyl reductase family protein [Streptomyces thermolineatus]|uniref:Trans-acting enoyl reductase family protein n=1 Tax=Streptomyces thermolineatus TaxID=44033 RepID=A0ABN3MRM9_9ACTN